VPAAARVSLMLRMTWAYTRAKRTKLESRENREGGKGEEEEEGGEAYGLFLDSAWDDDVAAVGYGDGAAGEHYALVCISTGRCFEISFGIIGDRRCGISYKRIHFAGRRM